MTTFKVDDKQYNIVEPTDNDLEQAEKIKRDALYEALNKPGAFIASQCMEKAKQMGIWSDAKQEELIKMQTRMRELTIKLNKGGYSASQAEKDANELMQLRIDIINLNQPIDDLASYSVDGYADQIYRDYLLFCQICDDKNQRVFKSFSRYIHEKNKDNDIIAEALNKIYEDVGKRFNETLKELPENKALVALGVLDEELKQKEEKKPKEEKIEFKPFTKK